VSKQKKTEKGPGARHGEAFYNPAMQMSRDLSILVYQWFLSTQNHPVSLIDGLAASGIRGVRLAHELTGDFTVMINDWNPQAYALIQKNIEHHHLRNAVASNKNLNTLLSEQQYHAIDIDPFGSPAEFIDSAFRSIRHNGLLACTATDTAPLCGVYPLVCLRRYGAVPFHSPVMHEIGLRILLGFLCREAGKYDKAVEPILCHATDYYFRVYVRVRHSKQLANECVEQLKVFSSAQLPVSHMQTSSAQDIGPLWAGHLQNQNIIRQVSNLLLEKTVRTRPELWTLLHLLEEEANAPLFFYRMEDVAAHLKQSSPPREYIFESLLKNGFQVTRTHFTPTGFKTDAPFPVIEQVFRDAGVNK